MLTHEISHLACSDAENQFFKFGNESILLCNPNEQIRSDWTSVLLGPSHERLHAYDLVRRQFDQRLVHDEELSFADCPSQLLHQASAVADEDARSQAKTESKETSEHTKSLDCLPLTSPHI